MKTMIEIKYFPIDEELAYYARQQWSFSDYVRGSITADYRNEVQSIYELAEKVAEQKPEYTDEALRLAEKFSREMASWWNEKHRIDMICPSVLICGPANFPIKKKERQNAKMQAHFEKLDTIKGIKKRIEKLMYGDTIIKSNDAYAIEKLQAKLDELVKLKDGMKEANKYYKAHHTLEGFTGLKPETIKKTMELISRGYYFGNSIYDTSNTNAKIRAVRNRLEQLQKVKKAGKIENSDDICRVIENSEIMRVQLVFDGKPSDDIRTILKSNGFVWSPKNKAWQRQLTDNARFATRRVLDQIRKLNVA